MHLWSAASQQINQSRVEGHDGVAHMNDLSFLLTGPETNGRKQDFVTLMKDLWVTKKHRGKKFEAGSADSWNKKSRKMWEFTWKFRWNIYISAWLPYSLLCYSNLFWPTAQSLSPLHAITSFLLNMQPVICSLCILIRVNQHQRTLQRAGSFDQCQSCFCLKLQALTSQVRA